MPVGCNGLEDWLLDNVEVSKLMPLLKKGTAKALSRMCTSSHRGCVTTGAQLDPHILSAGAGNEINVLQICHTKSTKAKTPKAKAQSKTYNPFDDTEVPTPVSVDELMTRRPGKAADNPFVDADTTQDAATPNEHEPKLDLPQLQTGTNDAVSTDAHRKHFIRRCTRAGHNQSCSQNTAKLQFNHVRQVLFCKRNACLQHPCGLCFQLVWAALCYHNFGCI